MNNSASQVEHLQQKYVGTGHADTTRHEFVTNIKRDSFASYHAHPSMVAYLAIANNDCQERVKFDLKQRMLQPCGPPPKPKRVYEGIAIEAADSMEMS